MLNELEQLRRSLSENGIQVTAWHPTIKPLAKYPTLVARLDAQGLVISVSSVPRDRATLLRNIQPDNQKSFPAFNLNCPLFEVPADVDPRTQIVTPDVLQSIPFVYQKKDFDRLRRLLHEFPVREVAPELLARSPEPRLSSTLRLLRILQDSPQTPEQFLRSFAAALLHSSQRGELANNDTWDVLFGKLTKKGVREPWKCILFLDLEDLTPFSHAVADPEVAAAWSEAMLMREQQDNSKDVVVRCALDGEEGRAIGNKMPNPNLPILGGTYLFSMNSEIPCQSRYGRTSTTLFPVSRRAIQGVNNALRHMTAPDLEGKTWSAVPSASTDKSKKDLLIAYIEEAPQANLPLAGVLGEFAEDEDENGSSEDIEVPSSVQMAGFSKRLERLLQAVRMEVGPEGPGMRHLRLFVLSTIDPGRKQVLFDARYSVDRLFAGRELWVRGAENAPALDVRLFQAKGKTIPCSRDVPSPATVARSFRQLWIRGAERSEIVSGVTLGRIYKLLLESDPTEEAQWLLGRFLPLKTDLLIAAGKPARDKKTGAIYGYTGASLSGEARVDLLTTSAVLGILLRILQRPKETYMNERDYLLGQLLQFADRLQIVYCHGVRGGQVPPQLIGNSLVGQAGQNPAKALEILHHRLPVYERYATQWMQSPEPVVPADEQEKDKEKRWLAQLRHKAWRDAPWIKAMLAKLSARVHQLGLEPTRGPAGQAELLLGYLAVPSKKEDGE